MPPTAIRSWASRFRSPAVSASWIRRTTGSGVPAGT